MEKLSRKKQHSLFYCKVSNYCKNKETVVVHGPSSSSLWDKGDKVIGGDSFIGDLNQHRHLRVEELWGGRELCNVHFLHV